jgi:uncharacterized coiled-coil protein SlyX
MYKDSQGDVWDSKTIKQIKTTQANNITCDINHDKIPVKGIKAIDTYQTKTIEIIGGKEVPIGSLRRDYIVSDNEVIQMIKNNQINGISPNNVLEPSPVCAKELKNISGDIFYNKDIENKECMVQIYDSFVEEPANNYGLNVYSYDKYLEKSQSSGGDKLSNKFKEMLKGFGESIIGYADGMDKIETNEQIEENHVNEVTMEKNNETTDNNKFEQELAELKKSVAKQEEELAELKKSETVKETESIDDLREKLRIAIIEKHFSDIEEYDIWSVLMTKESIIIENYLENKYYKVDYTVDDENNITIGDLKEVELQYAPIGEVVDDGDNDDESSEETTPESQKSKQPKVRTPKLESVEMEKSGDEKLNHLGMPIRSTKEIAQARNQFKF